jgi:methionine-rich copper-binding protein CopC
MRRLGRGVAVLALAGVGLVGLATPAFAHNSLTGSNPVNEASVDVGPKTVELTFDQPVQEGDGLNSVAVTGPDGSHWEAGAAEVDSNVVRAPVRELGPKGTYKIGYRIVSADGHPVSGELTFTLTKAAGGTPATDVPDSTGTSDAAGDSDGGGIPIWVWLVGAAVLLGVGLAFALNLGGKQSE